MLLTRGASSERPRHDSNVRHPASKAGALSRLSYGNMRVAGKLLEPEQRATWLHYGGRTDSTAGIRTRTSGSRGEGWLQLDGHGMSDGDRETVEAGSGVESIHVLSLSGMFSMDEATDRI